jgi:CheY-like chemotaxis protein
MTVLCVDDEELQLQIRKLLFEDQGFQVEVAQDGVRALEIFRTQKIDAVVLDYKISGMDGLAIAEEMKRYDSHIPIVILSGTAAAPGENTGCVQAWFQKASSDPGELVRVVEQLARQSRDRGNA